MGSAQSSEIKREVVDLAPTSDSDDDNQWMNLEAEESDDDSDYDSDDEDDDEGLLERLRILEDSRKLRMMADFFLHPEKPVKSVRATAVRCYFDRASAPQPISMAEVREATKIQKDAAALKKLAVDYMHPELPVRSSIACARCYYDRASAPQHELEEEEERAQILSEMKALKRAAYDYLHPEAPIATDSTAFGRNYFSRYSASQFLTEDEAIERDLVLEEAHKLSELARNAPIKVEPTTMGRNYFDRPSAPEQTTLEEELQREQILKDARALKKLAVWYQHPEKPVEVDSTACARNYFLRASAPEQEEDEYTDDRQIVLEEMKELKQVATDYMHPEKPLEVDCTAFGRNYFTRASAPEQEEEEYADEREIILEEMKELKQLASDFLHPEKPVIMDATAGRCYFDRPSAPEQEELDEEEKELILQEMRALKKFAVWYLHPELPVEVDAFACARNYYNRASAPDQEEEDYSDERAVILKEAAALKQKAVDFMHPELPVQTNPIAFGRNYFSRPSADEYEDDEYASMHERVHMDAAKLYHLAVDFLHPERPVKVDPTVSGRNYFNRPSAPEVPEDDEDAEERAQILKDAAMLKQKAVDFMHPELPLRTTDPTVFGRNFFSRPAAYVDEDNDDDEEEREHILADAFHLERLAMDYHHPEQPIQTAKEMETARNYYEPKYHHHHVHYDMEDDVHLHHVKFDSNSEHHHEITQVRVTTPSAAPRKIIEDFDLRLAMSPGCVMTFSNPKVSDMPQLPMSPECVMSFAHPSAEHWHPELPSLS